MHLDDVPKEKKYSKRDSQKAEKRFRQEMKKVQSRHTEYVKLVDDAQNIVPRAIHSTNQMFRLMDRMKQAYELTVRVQTAAERGFRQLRFVPRKKSYVMVRKLLSMSIIQAHHLTKMDSVMRVFVEIRKWMKDEGVKPSKKSRKAAKKK